LDKDLSLYDRELVTTTGQTLRQIACRAAGTKEESILLAARNTKVAVISVTAGQGAIPGFAGAVRAIINHLGFPVFVPEVTDVAGLASAVEQGADVVFMADDTRFVAVNLGTRRLVDNAEATGRGYVAALEGMARGLEGRRVLLIGAGRVGTAAAEALRKAGARIGLFDRDTGRAERLAREIGAQVEGDLERALLAYTILFDACPGSEFIGAEHVGPTTLMAAPGIPLGLTPRARSRIADHLIHDSLQIGVATMMISAISC
jgi:pyrrolysine biosynthesis protein PylD